MRAAVLASMAILCTAGLAAAQKGQVAPSGPNLTAEARYATVSLNAGFLPDPHEVRLEAGGDMDAAAAGLGADCVGWIDPARADVTLTYTAGQFPLFISAASQADTTLVVRDPSGQWHCNDDMTGVDPGVVLQRPASGEYRIWVGTLDRGQPQQATLRISEEPPRAGNAATAQPPNITAPARYATVNLNAGFMPDPHAVGVEAGGDLDISTAGLGGDCVGWIDGSRADVTLNYTPGQFPLYFSATSSADTTLVLRDPSGTWHCNDDMTGLDPGVVLQRPAAGEYRIWVGTIERGRPQKATLRISEEPPRR
ncbi:MAG TPA: hypothetical protein VGN83_07945 [Falsiroseomonas sp.]|jgi:opacity protein-like surface antigen|nr:hypothetical protein [Falsiroseomonas sp.]